MPLKIFIDTEFTDFIDCHLISLGMAAESGEDFYAEVPYPDTVCSYFVREAVIPLLGKIPHAQCEFEDLRFKILNWLDSVREKHKAVEICFDYQADWDLFIDALDYQVPNWCSPRPVARNINELLLYNFYKKHGLPKHHALYDAQANRYAFREQPTVAS
jgi:hypothetical protein